MMIGINERKFLIRSKWLESIFQTDSSEIAVKRFFLKKLKLEVGTDVKAANLLFCRERAKVCWF